MNTHIRKYNWTIFEDENKKDDQESGGEKEILEKKKDRINQGIR